MLYQSSRNNHLFPNLVNHKNNVTTYRIEQSISAHKWRHSLATELMNSSIPLKEIQNVLGHTELNTTQKYLHSNQEKTKKDILNVLSLQEM